VNLGTRLIVCYGDAAAARYLGLWCCAVREASAVPVSAAVFLVLLLFYFLCCIRDVVCSCMGRIAFVIAAANWSVVA
jgi:hypothetical protein